MYMHNRKVELEKQLSGMNSKTLNDQKKLKQYEQQIEELEQR